MIVMVLYDDSDLEALDDDACVGLDDGNHDDAWCNSYIHADIDHDALSVRAYRRNSYIHADIDNDALSVRAYRRSTPTPKRYAENCAVHFSKNFKCCC